MNYLIIHKTGKKAYSTNVAAYKIVKNSPVFIGEVNGISEDNNISYLCQCLKLRGKKLDVFVNKYRDSKVNIYKL